MLIGNTINAKLVSQQKSKLKSTSFKANETGNPGQSLFNNINLTPTTPIASASVTAPVQTTVQPQAQPQQVVFKEKKQNNGIDTDRTLLYAALAVSSVAAVAAITGGLSLKKAISKGDVTKLVDGLSNKFDSQIDELRKSIDAIAPNAKDAANAAVKSSVMSKGFVAALAGALGVGGAVVLTKDDQNKLDDSSKKVLADVNDAAGQIGVKIQQTKEIGEAAKDRALGSTALYTRPVMGLNLANKYEVDKRPVEYAKALRAMRTFADDRIRHKVTSNDIGINSTIWSMTSEFDPIKVGGLGVVPVHVQRNLLTKFNVDMPVFIPMYLNNGQSGYKAVYDNETGKMKEEFAYGKDTFTLERVMGFDVKKYVDGKPVNQEVKLYVSEKPDHTKLYFVKTDSSFEGGIYESTSVNDEKEKFALFSRAIYELAKYKLDPKSATGIKIYNEKKLDELKAPDGMFLNDWHAAPIAAISRYCSGLEALDKKIDKDAAEKLANMKMITVGHNVTYQGAVEKKDEATGCIVQNVLNTLFGEYTADIVENGVVELPPDDKDSNVKYDDKLHNVALLRHQYAPDHGVPQVNLLNMGIALSDYFSPVSPNYARELVEDSAQSGILRKIITARAEAGTLLGVLNGNDRTALGVYPGAKTSNGILEKHATYRPYGVNNSKEEVIGARLSNKKMILNEVLPKIREQYGNKILEEADDANGMHRATEFPKDIDAENTPFFAYAGRAASQKGLDILAESIKNTYKSWDDKHPGKPRPVFVIAAGDAGENGIVLPILQKLKSDLKGDDYNRVLILTYKLIRGDAWDDFKLAQTGADFGVNPSWFEPCGLIQSEEQAGGCIPISTLTGGFPSTMYDPEVSKEKLYGHNGQTGYLAKAHKTLPSGGTPEEIAKNMADALAFNVEQYTEAMERACKDYFDGKTPDIAYNALQVDHSWVKEKADGSLEGSVLEYLRLFGMKDADIKKAYDETKAASTVVKAPPKEVKVPPVEENVAPKEEKV